MYLKKDNNTVFPEDLRQAFVRDFQIGAVGKNEIIKLKNEGTLSKRDLQIAKFLFKVKFATAEQIKRFLITVGENGNNGVDTRLMKLAEYGVVNYFLICDDEEVDVRKAKNDGYTIFCLDTGGIFLLANYSKEDTSDWYTTTNMMSSENVSRQIFITEFYLKLLETCPDKLEYFNIEPELRVAKKVVIPSFEMSLIVGGTKKYFLGEVFREYDFPLHMKDKVSKLENILCSNAWKKYYYESETPPILFVFTDEDITALSAGKMITEGSNIKNFRLSTDDRIINNVLYEAGAFLRYSEPEELLVEIKASTFLP